MVSSHLKTPLKLEKQTSKEKTSSEQLWDLYMTNVLYNLQCFLNQRCTWCRIKTTWLMWLKFIEAWVNRLKPRTSSVDEVWDSFLVSFFVCLEICLESEYRNSQTWIQVTSPSLFWAQQRNRVTSHPKIMLALWLQRSFVKVFLLGCLSF